MNKDNTKKTKINNIVLGNGINLIPPKTDQEIITENVKSKVNLSAAISILILVMGTLLIIGFNAYSKINLNNKKREMQTMESKIDAKKGVLLENEELIRKALLYRDIEKSTISYKEVITFWQSITGNLATMESIDITSELGFKISGTADSLDSTSKLWYLLANDSRVNSVVLKTINKGPSSVRFSFEGQLNYGVFNKGE